MSASAIPVTPSEEKSSWQKVWDLLDRQERTNGLKVIVLAVVAAIASTFMVGSIMPFLSVLSDPSRIQQIPQLAWAYREFGFSSPYRFLVALGIGSVCVIVIAIGIQLLNIYASSRFAMMRLHTLSRRLMASYLGQPYQNFLNRHTGDMTTRVLSEAQEVVLRFILPATDLITAALTILALIGFLTWVNPLVTLAAFGVLGATYGGTYIFSRIRLNRLGRRRAKENAARYRLAAEAFGGIKEIKLLGREAAYLDRFSKPSYSMARALVQIQMMAQTPYYTIQAVALGGVILLCLVLIGPAGLGSGNALAAILPLLGVFAFAGQRMMPELGKLYKAIATIQSARGAVDAIYQDLVERRVQRPAPRVMPEPLGLRRELVLDGVTYRYPEADAAGINDISLTIRAGEKIGIVGETGAGKTTLVDVVLGLLPPREGTICSDGVAIGEHNVRNWQQSVGYVPQDIFLADASIAENIAFGVPPEDIDHDRVIAAAKAAHIDAFVTEELAQGYATFVGERGVRLSGGQRQRIGIARAFYHDADLIVFDEATSALDNLTEAEVMAAIDALPGDKTLLMIAHRLTTVTRCDRIIVMEHGRIAGCSDWQSLNSSNAAFQRIAKLVKTA